ncbi:MAG: DUF1549 domain-containing protein, partial [Planctomycetaceae bacterium]
QPVSRPDVSKKPPEIQTVDWLIDQQLQPAGLARSPQAPAAILVRRLAFAITGLPPELSDLQQAQTAADAHNLDPWLSEYTDRLLATPQYGERWGRYWLDVARYADTKGYVFT